MIVGVLPHRNTLAQLKDAYTKLFEDYNELKEEQKKKEVCLFSLADTFMSGYKDINAGCWFHY